MIRAQQANNNNANLERHEPKDDGVPPLEHEALKVHVGTLAPRKHGARVAHLRDGGLDERGEEAAAAELVLYAEPVGDAKAVAPLVVDLAIEIEVASLEGGVARNDEEGETYPEEEGVYGEEGTVVKEDAGPADDRGDGSESSSDGRDDKLRAVTHSDDVGMFPDVEPRAEKKYHGCERITGELDKKGNQ